MNDFLSVHEEPIYQTFVHSKIALSVFQSMYVIPEASLQSHELYSDDLNRLMLCCARHELKLDDHTGYHL